MIEENRCGPRYRAARASRDDSTAARPVNRTGDSARARPGIILFVQTFGDLVNFNPHIHVLAADGAFDPDGGFAVLPPIPRKLSEAARVRSSWARLIYKVYEVDSLECPRCKGPMRVIALIEDKAVIRKILTHLGLWVPQVEAGRGPGPPAPDPPRPAAQILTYHPVPDIA